jgi:hypothetical protein
MMKNTEWGAVAYLSHSKCGINKEININNNSGYMTGYSATSETNQTIYPGTCGIESNITLPYNTEIGYLASTTGNISGIYDMSGGAYEYMAAFKDDYLGESGFTENPINIYGNKYFDIYPSNSYSSSYSNRILGDATGELGPFYKFADEDNTNRHHNNWWYDSSHFVESSNPWMYRGGFYAEGLIAGQLCFGRNSGDPYVRAGFRLVLAN